MDKATQVTGIEHWAQKQTPDGEVRLFLWEKYVDTPEGKPAVLFVHGSSMASQPTFDLTVPGRPDSSVMDWFARRGFVCWSVDMEGYGRSDKKRDVLKELLRSDEFRNAIVFCNRKTTVRDLATSLRRSGFKVGQIFGTT